MSKNSLSKESKKGRLLKFTWPKEFDARLEAEMQKRGFEADGLCAKECLVDYFSYPHYPEYVALMKQQKQFELKLLDLESVVAGGQVAKLAELKEKLDNSEKKNKQLEKDMKVLQTELEKLKKLGVKP